MQVTVQYVLHMKEVPALLLEFGEGFETTFSYIIKSAIRDSCGDFTAKDFYIGRGGVQIRMLNRTQERLSQVHADAGFLQLKNVNFPTAYQQAVASKESAKASVDQALAQRKEALIAAETQVLQAEQQANIIKIRAENEAEAVLISARIDANTTLIELGVQSLVYKEVMEQFNFTGEELINFISIENLNSISQLFIGTESPGSYSFPQ